MTKEDVDLFKKDFQDKNIDDLKETQNNIKIRIKMLSEYARMEDPVWKDKLNEQIEQIKELLCECNRLIKEKEGE